MQLHNLLDDVALQELLATAIPRFLNLRLDEGTQPSFVFDVVAFTDNGLDKILVDLWQVATLGFFDGDLVGVRMPGFMAFVGIVMSSWPMDAAEMCSFAPRSTTPSPYSSAAANLGSSFHAKLCTAAKLKSGSRLISTLVQAGSSSAAVARAAFSRARRDGRVRCFAMTLFGARLPALPV